MSVDLNWIIAKAHNTLAEGGRSLVLSKHETGLLLAYIEAAERLRMAAGEVMTEINVTPLCDAYDRARGPR